MDVLIALAVVMLALGALGIRGPFAAVVLFIVYGLTLSLAWVRLDAVDVALAEAAIGAGLTGALLLEAVAAVRA